MLDVKEGIEQHPGHFQPKQCYIPYSETLRNSVKYSKNPVNHPFKKYIVLIKVMFYELRSLLRLKHCVSLRVGGTGCIWCLNLFILGATLKPG